VIEVNDYSDAGSVGYIECNAGNAGSSPQVSTVYCTIDETVDKLLN